jgi:hypothetical protein
MADVIPTHEQLREWITYGCDEPKRNKYPQEAIEPTLGIHGYMHKYCNRDINELVTQVRRRGIKRDYNYFYQLLTGRYFRANGAGEIQGAWRGVYKIWVQLKAFDDFATKLVRTRFVETSVWTLINNYVQRKRTPFSCCRFGAIRGHTGNQKTECFKEIIRRETFGDEEKKIDPRPGNAFHMECPADATLGLFIDKLNFIMGGPLGTKATKREHIRNTMLSPGRFLILDNIQRCFIKSAGSRQPIFDYLQELQEDTNSTIIICWTPVADQFEAVIQNEYFEQFIGRIGGKREILDIESHPSEEDIVTIAKDFNLSAADVEKLTPTLVEVAQEKGRVRVLFQTLQEGARLANTEGQPFAARHVLQYLGK